MSENTEEIWKEVVLEGFGEGGIRYQVSNLGNIKSFAYGSRDGRILKGGNVQGYKMVAFIKNKTEKESHYVHKLVASYFLDEPREDQKYVIHKDWNKQNNAAENLSWANKKEQQAHRNSNPNGRKIMYSKLNEEQVKELKKELRSGSTRLRVLSQKYGITLTQINRIRNGENWAHVTIDDED